MGTAQPQLSRVRTAAVTAALAAAMAAVGCGASDRGEPAATTAREAPRSRVPPAVQRYVHRTLHRLPRSCSPRRAEPRVLTAITLRFVELYRRYPYERYEMAYHDESGTMLSAILVLRNELATCSPRHAARIDPVIPPKLRRALRPVPASAR